MFPDSEAGGLDRVFALTMVNDRVHDADGEMVARVSHRQVPWTPIDVTTYWTAPGISDFSVHHTGRYWWVTSWRSPLEAGLEEVGPDGGALILYVAGHAIGRVSQNRSSAFASLASSYIAATVETG